MAKKKGFIITGRILGILLLIALLIQFVLPMVGIVSLANIGIVIYFLVALYLIITG